MKFTIVLSKDLCSFVNVGSTNCIYSILFYYDVPLYIQNQLPLPSTLNYELKEETYFLHIQ